MKYEELKRLWPVQDIQLCDNGGTVRFANGRTLDFFTADSYSLGSDTPLLAHSGEPVVVREFPAGVFRGFSARHVKEDPTNPDDAGMEVVAAHYYANGAGRVIDFGWREYQKDDPLENYTRPLTQRLLAKTKFRHG